jgi:hypothetical protein
LQPFEGLSVDQVFAELYAGRSIPQPATCPDDAFARLLRPCFAADPALRPPFSTLCQTLQVLLQDTGSAHSVFSDGRYATKGDSMKLAPPPKPDLGGSVVSSSELEVETAASLSDAEFAMQPLQVRGYVAQPGAWLEDQHV